MTARFIHYILLIIIIHCLSVCYSVFTIGSKRLPRATIAMNIAYDAYNDTVLLTGGRTYMRQLVLFKKATPSIETIYGAQNTMESIMLRYILAWHSNYFAL
eukprot:461048_1